MIMTLLPFEFVQILLWLVSVQVVVGFVPLASSPSLSSLLYVSSLPWQPHRPRHPPSLSPAYTDTCCNGHSTVSSCLRGTTATTTTHQTSSSRGGGGFGGKQHNVDDKQQQQQPPSSSSSSSSSCSQNQQEENDNNNNIYSLPALYDLAFGYRNYEEEVKFLLHSHRTHTTTSLSSSSSTSMMEEVEEEDGGDPRHVLELAAGPARHGLTALTLLNTPVRSVTAVDSSSEMQEYALQLATIDYKVRQEPQQQQPNSNNNKNEQQQQQSFRYICADMCQFSLEVEDDSMMNDDSSSLFDSAWILLGSIQHLQTTDRVLSCFRNVHNVLRLGGTLVVELPHPRETFAMVECTKDTWTVPLNDVEQRGNDPCGELHVIWGDDTDTFDPITQIRQLSVSFNLQLFGTTTTTTTKEEEQRDSTRQQQHVRQIVPMRLFTAQEIDALARCSGFEVAAMYGALDQDVAVDDEDEAFRLVCVLRKISTP